MGRMQKGWRPIAELLPGHYAAGRLDDGGEVHIFKAGFSLLNVATGEKIAGVVSGRSLPIRDKSPYLL